MSLLAHYLPGTLLDELLRLATGPGAGPVSGRSRLVAAGECAVAPDWRQCYGARSSQPYSLLDGAHVGVSHPAQYGVGVERAQWARRRGRQRLTNAEMGLFLLYLVPGNTLLGADQLDGRQINLLIVLCFAWYASRAAFFTPHRPRCCWRGKLPHIQFE